MHVFLLVHKASVLVGDCIVLEEERVEGQVLALEVVVVVLLFVVDYVGSIYPYHIHMLRIPILPSKVYTLQMIEHLHLIVQGLLFLPLSQCHFLQLFVRRMIPHLLVCYHQEHRYRYRSRYQLNW